MNEVSSPEKEGIARQRMAEAAISRSRVRAEDARRTRTAKTATALLFVVILLAAFVGVGAANGLFDSLGSADSVKVVDRQKAAGTIQTKTVIDSQGRKVIVPINPNSIAAMDPFSGELLVMCGAGSKICGIPGGVLSDKILQQIYPGLTTEPAQLSGNSVNIETLVERSCDVVLVRGSLPDSERAKLDRVGIPYVVVEYSTMDGQIAAMRLVGEVCGGEAQQKAEALAKYYEDVLTEVRSKAVHIPDDKRLRVYHSINNILLTDARDSLGADWITVVGCINVSAGMEQTSGTDYSTSVEQIYTWNPDVIICNVTSTARSTRDESKWSGLAAVSKGRVYHIPVGATRWGQRGDVETYLAVLWLGHTLYPEYYSDRDFKQRVVDYYRDYLGIKVDDELYELILSGEGIRAEGTDGGGGVGR